MYICITLFIIDKIQKENSYKANQNRHPPTRLIAMTKLVQNYNLNVKNYTGRPEKPPPPPPHLQTKTTQRQNTKPHSQTKTSEN